MIEMIVAPVDFSDTSLRAAGFATALARQLGAKIRFVTVLEISDLRTAMREGLHDFETNEAMHAAVDSWVKTQFARINPGGQDDLDIRRGLPEHEILAAIRDHKADMVVMGSEGITRRLPLGSKTEAVMRKCDVPVVVIRPAD